jgi:hypothetical protein
MRGLLKGNLIAAATLMLLPISVLADGTRKAVDSASGDAPGPTVVQLELRIDQLKHCIEQWYQAKLKGNHNDVERKELEILDIVREDMSETRKMVRHYATRTAIRAGEQHPVDEENEVRTDDQAAFERALSLLNVKEQLTQSFLRVNAFSNKYRLINDYVGLLRKQLDMPDVELAGGVEPSRDTEKSVP